MADTKSRPKFSVPPTLEELLNSREADDAEFIDVSLESSQNPQNPPTVYQGLIENVPEEVLKMRILAWLRHSGIYIARNDSLCRKEG